MKYGIIIEKINDKEFNNDYYYAHIPSLGLTTHGKGIDGAISAARDLLLLWLQEKKANNEPIESSSETFFSILELEEYAL